MKYLIQIIILTFLVGCGSSGKKPDSPLQPPSQPAVIKFDDNKEKVICIWTGGGSKGAFQAGVYRDQLAETGCDFSIGTSAGTINTLFMSTNLGIEGALEFWNKVEASDIQKRNRLAGMISGDFDGFYNYDPLREYLADIFKDAEFVTDCAMTYMDNQNGDKYFRLCKGKKPVEMIEYIVRSMTVGGYFEPVDGRWIDGGTDGSIGAKILRLIEGIQKHQVVVLDLHADNLTPLKTGSHVKVLDNIVRTLEILFHKASESSTREVLWEMKKLGNRNVRLWRIPKPVDMRWSQKNIQEALSLAEHSKESTINWDDLTWK